MKEQFVDILQSTLVILQIGKHELAKRVRTEIGLRITKVKVFAYPPFFLNFLWNGKSKIVAFGSLILA